jgi:hypothetical protein
MFITVRWASAQVENTSPNDTAGYTNCKPVACPLHYQAHTPRVRLIVMSLKACPRCSKQGVLQSKTPKVVAALP